jgi:glucose-6-phosphate 1-dehydrogenase
MIWTLIQAECWSLQGRSTATAAGSECRMDASEQLRHAQWRVVEPILDDATPVYPYKPETWGPDEAEALIGSDGPWRNPQAELEAAK